MELYSNRGVSAKKFAVISSVPAWPLPPEGLAFAALILLHLVPLWAFRFFPSQGGPNHVDNANVIREYGNPRSTAFRRYYVLNAQRETNWLGHLVLAGLMSVASPGVAESLFLSGYVVLLPLSLRAALRAIVPDSAPLAFVAFPFVYNYPPHMGFYNFAYSLPVFLFLVGSYWKHRGRFGPTQVVRFALLSLLLYLLHPATWAMGAIGVGVLALWSTGTNLLGLARQGPPGISALRRSLWNGLFLPFLSLLPALLRTMHFAAVEGGAAAARLRLQGLKSLYAAALLNTFSFYNLSEHRVLQFLFVGFTLLTTSLLVSKVASGGFPNGGGLLLVSAIFLLISFVAPDGMWGGYFLRARLLLFVLLSLILWFGSGIVPTTLRRIGVTTAAVVSLILLALRLHAYAELNGYLREYVSADTYVGPNSTLLPLSFLPYGPMPNERRLVMEVKPFQHAAGHIAATRAVDLTNYEAYQNYFPVRFRPELNPYTKLGDVEDIQGRIADVDFSTYAERTGGSVD